LLFRCKNGCVGLTTLPPSCAVVMKSEHLKFPESSGPLRGLGSSVGIATDYGLDGPGSNPGGDEIFRPSRPALGLQGTGSFPWGKVRPGRAADRSPPSCAAVMEEYSYTSTLPPGHTGHVTGSLYLYFLTKLAAHFVFFLISYFFLPAHLTVSNYFYISQRFRFSI